MKRNIIDYRLAPVHIKPKDADLYPEHKQHGGTPGRRRKKKMRKPIIEELDFPTSGPGFKFLNP